MQTVYAILENCHISASFLIKNLNFGIEKMKILLYIGIWLGSLKCASCLKRKVYIPKSYSFWVPLEVYIKRKSKIQCFGPVLSSWWFSIHLLELKIQLLWIPPCHTSKVASWLVDCWYEPHLWPYLSKNLLKVSKTVKIWQKCRTHEFSPVFETLSKFLLRKDHK